MDAEKERGRVSKIRPRLPVRLHESYNSSRVTGGRRWTVRPGSGLQKSARASRAAPVHRVDCSLHTGAGTWYYVSGLKKMCLSAHNREVVSWGRTFVTVVSLAVLLSKNVTSVDLRSTEEKFTM